MKISTVIVNWNTKDLLRECLRTLYLELERMSEIEFEVFVSDNDSRDSSVQMVEKEFPQVKLIANSSNLGFGRANNIALAQASGEYILLLNPDTEVHPGAIKTMLDFLITNPKAGIVAPQLQYPDGRIQSSCRKFPTVTNLFYEALGLRKLFPKVGKFQEYLMGDFDHNSLREVDQPQGSCLFVKKEVLDEVGVFDEQFFILFEEVDLCYRTKQAGWQIWFVPQAKILHHLGSAIKTVKVKMIFHSHNSLYKYWKKRHDNFFYSLISPLFYIFLMAFAVIRALFYIIKNKIRQ